MDIRENCIGNGEKRTGGFAQALQSLELDKDGSFSNWRTADAHADYLLEEKREDVEYARRQDCQKAMLDRLTLDEAKIDEMAKH